MNIKEILLYQEEIAGDLLFSKPCKIIRIDNRKIENYIEMYLSFPLQPDNHKSMEKEILNLLINHELLYFKKLDKRNAHDLIKTISINNELYLINILFNN